MQHRVSKHFVITAFYVTKSQTVSKECEHIGGKLTFRYHIKTRLKRQKILLLS